ncbi:hypothetical protein [Mycolicibacterium sp. D5.8-2]|uniref:hypothetical protein n=1 Tax=Mycolicibacterium sp. D5.8-2 TaxID=3085903 RepID=UPI00298C3215|nr:hypothetical protein [Mycolicibacterium sp. D5.8-2]MDW5610429.1 hypothetical protein [Mycolicibacterium sp. D5.8-2]
MLTAYIAWRYTRPGLRRAWLMVQMLWAAALTTLVTAPRASAAGFANAVGWTGITDTTGQPIGSYFIGTVSMLDAVKEQGSDVSMLDPSSWVPGLADRVQIALTYSQLATLLGLCCGFLVVVCALGIWFIKFALGSVWLGWLGALAAPIAAALAHFVQTYNIFPLAVVLCLVVGGILCYWRGFATGAAVMVSAYLVLLLIWVFLRDPVDELVGEHGLLAVARSLGFQISLGVGNNGSLGGGNVDSQTTVLSQWMATVLVRHPIQIANFGEVIDNYTGCAEAWNAALNRGSAVGGPAAAVAGAASGPVDAMEQCGRLEAVAHARQLSGETVGLMFFMNCIVLVLLLLLCYMGCEVIRIGFLTFWHILVLIPASAVAVAPGPQRQYAKRTAVKLLVHGVEMLFATAAFGVVLVIMSHVTGNSLPGMNIEHPIMKMIVMLLITAAAVFGFRALLRGFGDQGLPGPMTIAKRTMQFGMGPLGQAAAMRATSRDLRRMSRDDTRWPRSQQNSDAGSRGPQAGPGRRPHPPAPSGDAGSRGPAPRPGNGAPARGAPAPTSTPASSLVPAAATSTASGAGAAGARAAATAPAASAGAGAAGGGAAAASAAGTAGASVLAGPAAPAVAGAVVASKAVANQRNKRDDNASGRRSTPPPPSSSSPSGGGSASRRAPSGPGASAPPAGRDTSRDRGSDDGRRGSQEPPPSAGRRATPPQGER